MGYEIAGGLGAKLACPDREIYVLVGDGSYLMMAQELVTAVQENVKVTVVLVNNHGFASIGALSENVGAPRFGTWYRRRNLESGRLDGDVLPLDFVANAQSLGVKAWSVHSIDAFADALIAAKSVPGPVLIEIEVDPLVPAPDSGSWWDVPVAEVSHLDATLAARESYEEGKSRQRHYL
jgi:3D-(3,5/4)-trihydroxycyclohexane-1,2-dione acylhydrolase (decyclizing)